MSQSVFFGGTDASYLPLVGGTLTPAVGAVALTVAGVVQTASFPILDLAQTWNNAGVTFTGIKSNVTSTASAAASLLLDLQIGSVSQWNVTKAGATTQLGPMVLPVGSVGAPSLTFGTANTGMWSSSGSILDFSAGAVQVVRITSSGFLVPVAAGYFVLSSGGLYGWSSGTAGVQASDTVLYRAGAAASMQMGADVNGAAVAQTFKAHDGITGTDRSGANLLLAGGRGTGAGAVSQVLMQTPTVLGSGTTAQSLTTRVTIDSSGLKATGYLSSDGSAGVSAGPFTTITSITVKNGLVTALSGA